MQNVVNKVVQRPKLTLRPVHVRRMVYNVKESKSFEEKTHFFPRFDRIYLQ